MILFPPCKINLGLHILNKREDGYHNLETLFVSVPELCDVLEILPSPTDRFILSGTALEGEPDKNLVVKALRLLRQNREVPPCYIHLHKKIPSGAGLGGGSSDATSTLLGLNHVFSLGIKQNDLSSYAACLGSDCAFFVRDQAALACGTGTDLEWISLDATKKEVYLCLIVPSFSISTAQAYAKVCPNSNRTPLKSCLGQPMEKWKEWVENDFEKNLFQEYPLLEKIKQQLYEAGALYASLSGSGSALYGIFLQEPLLQPWLQDFFTVQTRIAIPLIHK